MLMDADHVRRYVARENSTELNTDDNADLEYRTPFEMLGRTDPIVAKLLPHAGWDKRAIMRGASAEIAAVERAFDERRRRARGTERADRLRGGDGAQDVRADVREA